ncbi:MAG: hypothetical protein ACLUFV_05120 [Acutalibacteraceae bacterium]
MDGGEKKIKKFCSSRRIGESGGGLRRLAWGGRDIGAARIGIQPSAAEAGAGTLRGGLKKDCTGGLPCSHRGSRSFAWMFYFFIKSSA